MEGKGKDDKKAGGGDRVKKEPEKLSATQRKWSEDRIKLLKELNEQTESTIRQLKGEVSGRFEVLEENRKELKRLEEELEDLPVIWASEGCCGCDLEHLRENMLELGMDNEKDAADLAEELAEMAARRCENIHPATGEEMW